MFQCQHILFPVDFSQACFLAAPYVANLARRFRSRITLLHVIEAYDPFGYGAASPVLIYGETLAAIEERRREELANFGNECFTGITAERQLQYGEPAEVITAYAADYQAQIIYMPTHGRSRFRRFMLGSVTTRVLHDSAKLILTTAHSGECKERDIGSEGCIICAVDLTSESVELLRLASELGHFLGLRVEVVHAIPYPDLGDVLRESAPYPRFLARQAREQLYRLQQSAGTNLIANVYFGHSPRVISDEVRDKQGHLVMVGRGRSQQPLGGLRSLVNDIIREVPCPVLSVAAIAETINHIKLSAQATTTEKISV